MASQRDGGIAWCDETWNPIRGCSRVSEGCRHCYAEKAAWKLSITAPPGKRPPYEGLVRSTADGARWTGEVRFVPEVLDQPLRWKRPRRIFVNSMSDLFHEKVEDEWIDRIFAVMARSVQHTFQVLTKRPDRMLAYCRSRDAMSFGSLAFPMPLPNVWLGVSVEDQATADARIPLLLQTPAAVRWVSYEPALGPVSFRSDWRDWLEGWDTEPVHACHGDEGRCHKVCPEPQQVQTHKLDWIVVGGESGPGARPFDLAWARDTIRQGRMAGVPVFCKQVGARPFIVSDLDPVHDHPPSGYAWALNPDGAVDRGRAWLRRRDRKGGDPQEWPADLRVREYPS